MSLLIHDETKNQEELEDNIYPIGYDSKNKKVIFVDDKQQYKTNSENDDTKFRIKNIYTGDKLEPIPYLKEGQRSAVYISGCSGCGKSTFSTELIDWYRILNKNKKEIFLFTRADGGRDPAFKKYENEVITKSYRGKKVEIPVFNSYNVEEDFNLVSQIKVKNLHDSIVIFDDWESINDVKKKQTIYCLIKKILEEGRKLSINVIIITHGTMQGNLTKPILFESDSYVVFPLTGPRNFRSLLTNYSEVDKDEIDNILKSLSKPHDFLFYHKSYPQYYMTPYMIKMI